MGVKHDQAGVLERSLGQVESQALESTHFPIYTLILGMCLGGWDLEGGALAVSNLVPPPSVSRFFPCGCGAPSLLTLLIPSSLVSSSEKWG